MDQRVPLVADWLSGNDFKNELGATYGISRTPTHGLDASGKAVSMLSVALARRASLRAWKIRR